jgi:selenocysteine lyase/cysteine desulfurase
MSTASGPPPLPLDAFDLDPEILWIMHCSEGPVPRAAAQAVRKFLPRETRPWNMRWEEDFLGLPNATGHQAARLLGARREDIALTPTTSTGLVAIAQGFPWTAGDEVISPLGEFPSNAWPWLALAHRRVSWREVPLWDGHRAGQDAWDSTPPPADVDPESRLLAAIGPRTRILALSWVRFQDGLCLDLQRLAQGCREHEVALVVDGIQGAGTLPVSLDEGVDAFVAGGHKGLLAPQGLGLLWTSEEFRVHLVPTGTWLAVEDGTDFARPSTDFERGWLDDSRCFDQGVPNLLACAALHESLRLLADTGVETIAHHVQHLRQRLLTGLTEILPWWDETRRLMALEAAGRLGPILALHHGRDRGDLGKSYLDKILQEGFRRGIHASVREGFLRLAFHGWHGEEDVDRVLEWLRACQGGT